MIEDSKYDFKIATFYAHYANKTIRLPNMADKSNCFFTI